jgi:2-polyprenyl-3-methyl-5-hydroxy-6-metoxy-1,4-benzoquinol methylase
LLEVGCSQGHLLEQASEHFQVEGIDISEYAISSVSSSIRSRVTVADIEQVDLPEGRYDVVVAFNIFEHLGWPKLVIAKIHRSLRDGGFLIGSVPNKTQPITSLYARLTNLFDRTHRSTFATDCWHRLFVETRYRKVELFGEIPAGMNACLYLKGLLWRHCALNLMFVCWK